MFTLKRYESFKSYFYIHCTDFTEENSLIFSASCEYELKNSKLIIFLFTAGLDTRVQSINFSHLINGCLKALCKVQDY